MGRAPCCEKVGLKKGPWTPEEDQKLVSYINDNGHGSWRALPKKAGLLRCGKSCRLRWTNYLRPDIKRGEFCLSEEQTIIQLHALLGNRWSAIASYLPKRTDNEIKNYWNTHLKKKLLKMGIDPSTHKPKLDNALMSNTTDSNSPSLLLAASSNINGSSATNHMAQWETARLEAEARLVRESHMRAKGLWPAGGPISVASPSTLPSTSWGSQHFSNDMNNSSLVSSGALKALSAVELMNALQNWEKSLQGQAGLLWPDSWRFPNMSFATREVQADSSSCSSPSTDANTNPTAIAAPPHHMDHSSPTSTLCSLDSQKAKQKCPNSSLLSSDHIRKLAWGDTLAPPKLEVPFTNSTSFQSLKAVSGFCLQGLSCKIESDTSTFSSLMQDVVFAASAIASPYFTSSEEGGSIKNNPSEEGVCDKMGVPVEGVSIEEDLDEDSGNKRELDNDPPSALASTTAVTPVSGGLLGELEVEETEGTSSDNQKSMISSDMFKDLPKLKSEAQTPHISYSALLTEEIPDYWSNIMLKEVVNSPTLQQVDIAQGITF